MCIRDSVKDDKVSVGKYVESVAKKLGGKIDVVEYGRFERGEGERRRKRTSLTKLQQ